MAAAATILAEIVEGGLDRGLVTAVHRHEEGVGLAGRGFLGVEKLVPVGPDRGFSDIFAGRARTVGPGGEQLRNFLSRLGEIDGTCLGLRQIPLALDISLDGPRASLPCSFIVAWRFLRTVSLSCASAIPLPLAITIANAAPNSRDFLADNMLPPLSCPSGSNGSTDIPRIPGG